MVTSAKCKNPTVDIVIASLSLLLLITILILLVILYIRIGGSHHTRFHRETRSAFYTDPDHPMSKTSEPTNTILSTTSRPSSQILGSGDIITQTKPLPTSINSINVSSILNVIIRQGTEASMRSEIPSDLVPFFQADTRDNHTLFLNLDLNGQSVIFPEGKKV